MARQSANNLLKKNKEQAPVATPLAVKDESKSVATTVAIAAGGNKGLSVKVKTLERRRRDLTGAYRNQPSVVVTTSPSYRKHFGKTMPIILNGIAIYVPLDGGQYKIPKSFASVFYARISRVDEQEVQLQNAANIKNNFETFPGEKPLITRA